MKKGNYLNVITIKKNTYIQNHMPYKYRKLFNFKDKEWNYADKIWIWSKQKPANS